jgi:hypothetical protein
MRKVLVACFVLGVTALAGAGASSAAPPPDDESRPAQIESRYRCIADCEIMSRPINCRRRPRVCAAERRMCERSCPYR